MTDEASTQDENENPDDSTEETDNGGTTDVDYRWKWLATVWAIIYGIGFPGVAWGASLIGASYPPGTLMVTLTLAWLGTVIYIIGPENVKAAKELRGK